MHNTCQSKIGSPFVLFVPVIKFHQGSRISVSLTSSPASYCILNSTLKRFVTLRMERRPSSDTHQEGQLEQFKRGFKRGKGGGDWSEINHIYGAFGFNRSLEIYCGLILEAQPRYPSVLRWPLSFISNISPLSESDSVCMQTLMRCTVSGLLGERFLRAKTGDSD